MTGLYARWMDRWERKLATRDTNRVVRPFEWGTDWLNSLAYPSCPAEPTAIPRACVARFVTDALADSDRFFCLRAGARTTELRGEPPDVHQPGAVRATRRTIRCTRSGFRRPRTRGRALVVLPQWNSGPDGHVGLAKLLNRFGISALRMTMAYHAERKPAEIAARRLSCFEQRGPHHPRLPAIGDRCARLRGLAGRTGIQRVGILGTSLGSCVAFIAAAHDTRVQVGIFNHVSMYFSDVVWTGLSTQNVRQGFRGHVSAGRVAAVLERDQSGQLSEAVAGTRFEDVC